MDCDAVAPNAAAADVAHERSWAVRDCLASLNRITSVTFANWLVTQVIILNKTEHFATCLLWTLHEHLSLFSSLGPPKADKHLFGKLTYSYRHVRRNPQGFSIVCDSDKNFVRQSYKSLEGIRFEMYCDSLLRENHLMQKFWKEFGLKYIATPCFEKVISCRSFAAVIMKVCFSETSEREKELLTDSRWSLVMVFWRPLVSIVSTMSRHQITFALKRASAVGIIFGVSESRWEFSSVWPTTGSLEMNVN